MDEKRCAHCGCPLELKARSRNQRYCGKKECQGARKRLWQKNRMATDPDYQDGGATGPGGRKICTIGVTATAGTIPSVLKGIACCREQGGTGDALQRWSSAVKSFWFR